MKVMKAFKVINGNEPRIFRDKMAIATKKIVEARGGLLDVPKGLAAAADKIVNAMVAGKNTFICGGVGTGKTTIAKAIGEVSDFFWRHGRGYCMAMLEASQFKHLDKDLFLKKFLCIDDLGCEPEKINDFGTLTNVLGDIIAYRYEHNLYTLITSNLSPAQIKERYGERVADRMYESYEIVHFNWSSFRRRLF